MEADVTNYFIRNCQHKFKCKATWQEMTQVKGEDFDLIRRCTRCKKDVYLTTTEHAIAIHIEYNCCIAIPEVVTWGYRVSASRRSFMVGDVLKWSV
jgi:hypothetical protein